MTRDDFDHVAIALAGAQHEDTAFCGCPDWPAGFEAAVSSVAAALAAAYPAEFEPARFRYIVDHWTPTKGNPL